MKEFNLTFIDENDKDITLDILKFQAISHIEEIRVDDKTIPQDDMNVKCRMAAMLVNDNHKQKKAVVDLLYWLYSSWDAQEENGVTYRYVYDHLEDTFIGIDDDLVVDERV